MNYITNQKGDAISPRMPLPVADSTADAVTSKSHTLTYNGKAAAGAITVNATTYYPIYNVEGDRAGSYWGIKENLLQTYTSNVAVTTTDGAAALVVTEPSFDFELAYETSTGTKRFIAKIYDTDGSVLYGWVAGIAKSTNAYTVTIYSTPTGTTQDWVGTDSAFGTFARLEIYRNSSSLVFGTGTTLTEEVRLPDEYAVDQKTIFDYVRGLSNGQYVVDYYRGWIVGKRADTTASETITYNVVASSTASVTSGDVNVTQIGGNTVNAGAGAVGTGTLRTTLASDDPAVTALQVIDDWDETDRAKVNIVVGQAGVTAGAGAVAANTPRVTLASDDPGVALLTTIDADTGNIATNTTTLAGAVSGTEMQVDVVAALPAGTNNIGDVDVLSITNGSLNGPGSPTIDSYTHVAINLSAGANQVLVSSAPSKQIWVYGIGFTVNVAGTVSFQDEDDVAITGIMNFAANGGISHSPSGNFAMPMWKLGTDKDLEVDIVTSELDGWLAYAIVSV